MAMMNVCVCTGMDPHTEKHRFTCTNVAKGGSNACTGASMPAGYVVLIVLACLMPLACLLYHYRARIRDLFESMKVRGGGTPHLAATTTTAATAAWPSSS